MRIWDVSAGYLNRQSLLGEHRELHGLYNILVLRKDGYSRHPETLRWVGAISGLVARHAQLAAEMRLRGYVDRTALLPGPGSMAWPDTFITDPLDQIDLLRGKYAGRAEGRIPLPQSAQELWAHYKYSVMARDPAAYRRFGRAVSSIRRRPAYGDLARDVVLVMREQPSQARVINALEHMWGYVSGIATPQDRQAAGRTPAAMLLAIQVLAVRCRARYLLSSTALSELSVHIEPT